MNSSRFARSARRERGQAAVFLVLAMGLFLIGGVGFVVDGANLWFHRQTVQTAADAACTAGAMDMLSQAGGVIPPTVNWVGTSFQCTGTTGGSQNSSFPPCAYASLNGYSGAALQGIQVSFPASSPNSAADCPSPGGGGALPGVCSAGDLFSSPYMQVTVTDNVRTTFMRLVGAGPSASVRVRSTCGLSNVLSALPIVVLDPNIASTMTASNSSTLTVLNGPQKSIQVNSSDPGAVDLSNIALNLSQANSTDAGEFAVASREADPGATGSYSWVNTAGLVTDPFASINAPAQPAPAPTPQSYNAGSCPGFPSGPSCTIYSPGYYAPGLPLTSANSLMLFEPGLYYLDGDLMVGVNNCVRPAPDTGTNGTFFYFHGAATLSVSGQSGSSSSCNIPAVPLASVQCPTSNPMLSALPSSVQTGGLTGNVLLAPCSGTYTDVFGNQQNMGDPLGNNEQRGMLFFHDRDTAPSAPPKWHGGASFGLIGNIYFHYCASSDGSGRGSNCSSSAFTDVFQLGSFTDAYIVGDIVVDQLELGQRQGNSPITVVLNPNPQYYVLKASLLQ